MSEASEKYRKEAKAKVERLVNQKEGRVDASDYKVPDMLDNEVKTGMRPISKRAYKRGGKIEGCKASHHAGRKTRKDGGALSNINVKEENNEREGKKHIGGLKSGGRAHRATGGPSAAQQLVPNVPTSGLYGIGSSPTHAGMLSSAAGLKKGGEAKKRAAGGGTNNYDDYPSPEPNPNVPSSAYRRNEDGSVIEPKGYSVWNTRSGSKVGSYSDVKRARRAVDKHDNNYGGYAHRVVPEYNKGGAVNEENTEVTGTRPVGGRLAKADGGRAKGKTNINIIIGQPRGPDAGAVPPPPSAIPPAPPMPKPGLPPAAMMPPGAGAPPMGGGAPPMPPQMPRAAGGRTYPIDTSAAGGLGRLEKIKAYGPK